MCSPEYHSPLLTLSEPVFFLSNGAQCSRSYVYALKPDTKYSADANTPTPYKSHLPPFRAGRKSTCQGAWLDRVTNVKGGQLCGHQLYLNTLQLPELPTTESSLPEEEARTHSPDLCSRKEQSPDHFHCRRL